MVENSTSFLQAKHFSFSEESMTVPVSTQSQYVHLNWEELQSYVTVLYHGAWWIAYILDKNEEKSLVCVSFMH